MNGTCRICQKECEMCYGLTRFECTRCAPTYFLEKFDSNTCVSNCSNGRVPNVMDRYWKEAHFYLSFRNIYDFIFNKKGNCPID